LAVCEVLLEICLLHLFISWKSSSWAVDSTETSLLFFPSQHNYQNLIHIHCV
jgi:hypothetical protein